MKTPLFVPWLLALALSAVAGIAAGQTAPSADPKLVATYVQDLAKPDLRVRLAAADELARMGPAARDAVPALAHLVEQGPETQDRMAGAMALARMGPEAKAALPALRQMAKDPNERLQQVALAAIESIDPPLAGVVWEKATSPYGLATAIALVAGVLALVAMKLHKSSGIEKQGQWTPDMAVQKQAERIAARQSLKANKPPPPPPKPVVVPVVPVPRRLTKEPSVKPRARVSRSLSNFESYVTEQEGPDTVKRELTRAQEGFKLLCEIQQKLAKDLEKDEIKRDPERLRQLEKDIDDHGTEHYRAEVRIKALEIKMLELLVGDAKTADQALRERSEAAIKQKWDALQELCEKQIKIVWRANQWATVTTAPKIEIEDLRTHLLAFDVVMPGVTPQAPEAEEAAAPEAEAEAIELMTDDDELAPEEIERITAEAEAIPDSAVAEEPAEAPAEDRAPGEPAST
jgi:hypothetical protein